MAAALLLAWAAGACRTTAPHSQFRVRALEGDRIIIYELPSGAWPSTTPGSSLLAAPSTRVFSGLDLMNADGFSLLRGRSFALLTNATGLDHNLERGLDLMLKSGIRPFLLLEPEHGLYGFEDRVLDDSMREEPRTGIRIVSLYSKKRKPTAADLAGVDIIVVDIHNLPVRCYTYVTTLTYVLEAAEELGIQVMILDRPNPYGFWHAAGALLEESQRSFISFAPVPYMYSMTPGEYALWLAVMRLRGLRLSIVLTAGYERSSEVTHSGYAWINPSPNIPSMEAALVYPAVVFFEASNFSVGRGTTRPFVYTGAPWLRSTEVLGELRALKLPGAVFGEIAFTPTASEYHGQICRGIQIIPTSREFDPIRTGYEYMQIVMRLHPGLLRFRTSGDRYFIDMLWGDTGFRQALERATPYDDFKRTWIRDGEEFEETVRPFRLY